MKNKSSILTIAFMGLLLFVGCEKDGVKTFTATTTPYNGAEKAYINISGDSAYMYWTDGDQVQVNNTSTTVSVRVVNGKTRVELSVPTSAAVGSHEPPDEYYAIYPASLANGGYSTVTIPSTQTYRVMADGTQIIDAPMAAKVTGEGNTLNFSNLATVLRVHFDQSDNVLNSISVEATGPSAPNLAGTYPINWGTTELNYSSGSSTSTSVTLDMPSGVNLNVSGGKDIYVVIAPIGSGAHLTLTATCEFDMSEDETPQMSKAWSVVSQHSIPANSVVGLAGPSMIPAAKVIEFYDWLYSQESGYIDLNVKPALGAKMELTFAVTNASASQYLCGCRGGGGQSTDFQWFTLTGAINKLDSGFFATLCGQQVRNSIAPRRGGWSRETGVKYTESVTVCGSVASVYGNAYFKNWKTGATNTLTTASYVGGIPETPAVNNVLLFGIKPTQLHPGMKCYNFRYYSGETLVHDFVPAKVLRPSKVNKAGGGTVDVENTVGMYDTKTKLFYVPTPASGTPTPFTVGND